MNDDSEPARQASAASAVAIGDLVISWDDDEAVEYGGPADTPGRSTLSVQLLAKTRPTRKCDPEHVAPATVAIPERDARVNVAKRPREEMPNYAAGPWKLSLPGVAWPSWHRTKRDATATGLRRLAIMDWHGRQAAASASADVLTPYTVTGDSTRAYRVCWLNRETLEPGTAAFTDGQGVVVCADCSAHCTSCTDPACDHPRYTYAA